MTGASAAQTAGLLLALALGVATQLSCRATERESAPAAATVAGDELRSQLALSLALELGNGQPAQQLTIEGTWSERAVSCATHARCLALSLRDAKVSAPGAAADAAARDLASLAQQLGTPFLAAYGRDGSLAKVGFAPGTHQTVQNLLQLVAAQLQFVAGAAQAEHWVAEERDAAGEYMAAYHRAGQDVRQVLKQKREYLRPAVAHAPGARTADARAEVRVVESAARHDFDARGIRIGFEGRETLQVSMGPLAFTSALALRLQGGKRSAAADLGLDLAQHSLRPVQQLELDPDQELARSDRNVLGKSTLESLLAELPVLAPSDRAAHESLRRRCEALCRLEPGSCAALAREVTRRPEAVELLLGALGMVQSEAAHAALLALASDASHPVAVRTLALRYLSRATLADAQLKRLALQLDDPEPRVRATARFAYGAVARIVRDGRPESARHIATTLLGRLAGARGAEQLELVRALGNAGAAEAAPSLLALARGADAALAREALNALRFVELPEVDVQFETAIRGGAEPRTRIAALEATRFRSTGALVPAIVEAARRDADAEVRRAALDQLGARLGELPQLREVLVESTRDRDANVRRTAQRNLDVSKRG